MFSSLGFFVTLLLPLDWPPRRIDVFCLFVDIRSYSLNPAAIAVKIAVSSVLLKRRVKYRQGRRLYQ